MIPEQALAVYGTLAPGQSNHHVVADIDDAVWVEAAIRGRRFEAVWSGTFGYPAFVSEPDGPLQPVLVLMSEALPDHWERLDAFEGPGYQRRIIEVFDRSGDRSIGRACVYETLPEAFGPE